MIISIVDAETGEKIYEIPLKERRERRVKPVIVTAEVEGEIKRYVVAYDLEMVEEMIKENA